MPYSLLLIVASPECVILLFSTVCCQKYLTDQSLPHCHYTHVYPFVILPLENELNIFSLVYILTNFLRVRYDAKFTVHHNDEK